MPLYKLEELRNQLNEKEFRYETKAKDILNKYAGEKLVQESRSFSLLKTYDIFLSHSFKDAAPILRLKQILEGKGYSVYVDWIEDKDLNRSKVNTETAKVIRERLKGSKCLIYAVTSNSVTSSWVQWELGLGDGQKDGRVAILPLLESEETNPTFYKQEYLGLYPYVDNFMEIIYVNGKNLKRLDQWILEPNPLVSLMY